MGCPAQSLPHLQVRTQGRPAPGGLGQRREGPPGRACLGTPGGGDEAAALSCLEATSHRPRPRPPRPATFEACPLPALQRGHAHRRQFTQPGQARPGRQQGPNLTTRRPHLNPRPSEPGRRPRGPAGGAGVLPKPVSGRVLGAPGPRVPHREHTWQPLPASPRLPELRSGHVAPPAARESGKCPCGSGFPAVTLALGQGVVSSRVSGPLGCRPFPGG